MKKPHIPGVTADYAIVLLQNSGDYAIVLLQNSGGQTVYFQ